MFMLYASCSFRSIIFHVGCEHSGEMCFVVGIFFFQVDSNITRIHLDIYHRYFATVDFANFTSFSTFISMETQFLHSPLFMLILF